MESYFVELTGIGESHLNKEEIKDKKISFDEALIQCEYSLISAGTELSRAYALKKGFSYPVRPGYCGVGKILKKGTDIEAEIGDRVFFNAPHASLVKWKNSDSVQGPLIMKLDEDIDPLEATFINLLFVALQGVNLTNTKLGDRVAVFGLGNIGILCALMYQKAGCEVIGIDPMEHRCALARTMGLKHTAHENALDAINLFTNKEGVDIAVDASGLSEVIVDCIKACGKYGQVLLLGSPRIAYQGDLTSVFSLIHMKDLKIIGGFNQTIPVKAQDGSKDCLERNFRICQDLLRNKDIDVRKLITKVIDPKDCQKAYEELMYYKNEVNGIVYDWRNYSL
ncbi:MAG: zinc-binding alcohol dehydrogenase [Erysipelotrichaceae bacterium]|nr:zinc-binding alcohol dehydrogenase [Erysipelotrichaceae bacterium]